jgi:hypothetical protein
MLFTKYLNHLFRNTKKVSDAAVYYTIPVYYSVYRERERERGELLLIE